MTATKNYWKQKNIYVPGYLDSIWDMVNTEARESSVGVGHILLAAYAKQKKIVMMPYPGKGHRSDLEREK